MKVLQLHSLEKKN